MEHPRAAGALPGVDARAGRGRARARRGGRQRLRRRLGRARARALRVGRADRGRAQPGLRGGGQRRRRRRDDPVAGPGERRRRAAPGGTGGAARRRSRRTPRRACWRPRCSCPAARSSTPCTRFRRSSSRSPSTSGSGPRCPGSATGSASSGRWDPARAREIDWAHGAFLLVRRVAFEAVGGFDAGQWMYAEDLDLAWRLAAAGWARRFVPAARVGHEVAAATGQRFGDDERAAAAHGGGPGLDAPAAAGGSPRRRTRRSTRSVRRCGCSPWCRSPGSAPGASPRGASSSGATCACTAPPCGLGVALPAVSERLGEISWYHTQELGPGVVTQGMFDLRPYVERYGIPADLTGLRALDVGTFEGFWAFELERRGAEVVAIDVDSIQDLDWPPRPAPRRRRAPRRGLRGRPRGALQRRAAGGDVRLRGDAGGARRRVRPRLLRLGADPPPRPDAGPRAARRRSAAGG